MHLVPNMFIFTMTLVTYARTIFMPRCCLNFLEGGLLVERLASGGLGGDRIAWLTTRRILISLCCISFSFFGGALASVSPS